jgi:hypothetical protein
MDHQNLASFAFLIVSFFAEISCLCMHCSCLSTTNLN